MSLCGEHKSVQVESHVLLISKEEVEIFEHLSKHIGVHSVGVCVCVCEREREREREKE